MELFQLMNQVEPDMQARILPIFWLCVNNGDGKESTDACVNYLISLHLLLWNIPEKVVDNGKGKELLP